MKLKPFIESFHNVWSDLPVDSQKPAFILYLAAWGFFIGALVGAVISFFRVTTAQAYHYALRWTSAHATFDFICLWFALAIAAALAVGFFIRNPAIRFGGRLWIREVMADGQPHSWIKILIPKFIGSWLVMSFGTSVGHEGPSIQMGAATALGLKKFDKTFTTKRRFFILAGCAAGLSAAFSTPFAGICYVYEIMKEKISSALFMFMLAGAFGVYVSCSLLFGLDLMLPVGAAAPLPDIAHYWLVLPAGICCGLVGVVYNYALRASLALYDMQKIITPCFRPIISFLATALAVLIFPAVTGEGLSIFTTTSLGGSFFTYLGLFLVLKLVLTAFSYGSGIPAGLMVPLLCVGGVAGALYAGFLNDLSLIDSAGVPAFILMGMAATFAAGERAPITAIVITAQMTGAYETLPGLLLSASIGAFCGRLAKVRSV